MTRAGVLARASVLSSRTSSFDHSRRFPGFLATWISSSIVKKPSHCIHFFAAINGIKQTPSRIPPPLGSRGWKYDVTPQSDCKPLLMMVMPASSASNVLAGRGVEAAMSLASHPTSSDEQADGGTDGEQTAPGQKR